MNCKSQKDIQKSSNGETLCFLGAITNPILLKVNIMVILDTAIILSKNADFTSLSF